MTAALELDFGTAARRYATRGGSILLGISMLLAIACGFLWHRQQARYQLALQATTARSQQATKVTKKERPMDAHDTADFKAASAALDDLSVDWESLFSAIETAGADDLGVLTLVPDPHSGLVRISADAPTVDKALGYVSRLAAQPMFRDVALSSYQTVPRQGSDVVEFVVVARWK